MKAEYSLLNAILTQNRIAFVIKKLKPYHFGDDYAREVYKFFCKFFKEYHKTPSSSITRQKFREYDYQEENGDINYLVNEVMNKYSEYKLLGILNDAANKLKENSSEEVLNYVISNGLKLRSESQKEEDLDLLNITDEIIKDYQVRKERGAISGIPSGIPSLDNLICGWQNGELINIMAGTGIGKSFLATHFATHAWRNGYKPLYISFEMSPKQIYTRVLALQLNLNPRDIKHGQLTEENEQRLKEYLNNLKNATDGRTSFIVSSPHNATQSSVLAAINNHNPDIVFVDYITLMKDENGDKSWEAVKNISRDLKNFARKCNIPVISLCQANREFDVGGSEPPELDNVGYSRAIAQDSDIIISIHQNNDQRNDGVMKAKVVKMRDGEVGLLIDLMWYLNDGIIRENIHDFGYRPA